MKIILLDLDNTISDDAWRHQYVRYQMSDGKRRYHDYNQLCGFDECRNHHLFEDLKGNELIIVTTRPNYVRPQTKEWLRRNKVPFKHIIMRNNSDTRFSAELKKQQLLDIRQHYNIAFDDIECAYDDRKDVIDMYTKFGVKNFHIWINERAVVEVK